MEPLTERGGDPERGRAAVLDRERGHCLLCHRIAQLDEGFQGNIGPPLSRVGERLTPAELRARLVDPTRLNPATAMPAYHRTERLRQVAEAYRGEPILTAQEVEDVVAFLETLVRRRGEGPDAVLATGSGESERGEPDKGESDRGESGRRKPGSSEAARKETVSNASGRRAT
jgi:sulfur-oxidizing protein SoxX